MKKLENMKNLRVVPQTVMNDYLVIATYAVKQRKEVSFITEQCNRVKKLANLVTCELAKTQAYAELDYITNDFQDGYASVLDVMEFCDKLILTLVDNL